jgi:hypothetical protein
MTLIQFFALDAESDAVIKLRALGTSCCLTERAKVTQNDGVLQMVRTVLATIRA